MNRRILIGGVFGAGMFACGAFLAGAAAAQRSEEEEQPIVEVRTYVINEGERDRFVELFDALVIPAFRAHDIRVVGSFVSREDDVTFVWMRGFDSERERDEKLERFYSSEEWERIAPRVMPFLVREKTKSLEVTPTPGSPRLW